MSSNSYEGTCPNCQGVTQETSWNKPYPSVSGDCLECGFNWYAIHEFMTLDALNEMREEHMDMQGETEPGDVLYPPLKELPPQTFGMAKPKEEKQ